MSWSMMGRDLDEYWMERQASYEKKRRLREARGPTTAEQNQEIEGLPYSTTGDAKKGAGLFKVSSTNSH